MMRSPLAALALLATLALAPRPVAADEQWVPVIHAAAARHGVSGSWLERTLRCESALRPGALGAAGERGIAQLHPQGELRTFFAEGFSDPFVAEEAIEFAAGAFAAGRAAAWTCARR